MPPKKRRTPRRNATRPSGHLSVVGGPAALQHEPPPGLTPLPLPPGIAERLADDVSRQLAERIAGSLLTALAQTRHRMDAELVVTTIFGAIEDGADDPERAGALTALIVELVAAALGTPSPERFGLVQLLADQGPGQTRELAAAAAAQMAQAGLRLPRWAQPAPMSVSRAWVYGDTFGVQTTLGISFTYGHRQHTMLMLIDYRLTGGAKDIYFAPGDGQRAHDQNREHAAGEPTTFFRDITEAEALTWLNEALALPPCPEQPDQVDDIEAYLYLAHTRARQLAARVGEPAAQLYAEALRENGDPRETDDSIAQIKVSLDGSKPPFWRRLELPASTPVRKLPEIIQAAFGWKASSQYGFETSGAGSVTRPLPDGDLDGLRLQLLLPEIGAKATYVHQSPRAHPHTIVLEKTHQRKEGAQYPICTGGRRAAPPEGE